jgi:hypothetical protein
MNPLGWENGSKVAKAQWPRRQVPNLGRGFLSPRDSQGLFFHLLGGKSESFHFFDQKVTWRKKEIDCGNKNFEDLAPSLHQGSLQLWIPGDFGKEWVSPLGLLFTPEALERGLKIEGCALPEKTEGGCDPGKSWRVPPGRGTEAAGAGLKFRRSAKVPVNTKELPEARTLKPVVVQGEEDGDSPLLRPSRQAKAVMKEMVKVDHVRLKALEDMLLKQTLSQEVLKCPSKVPMEKVANDPAHGNTLPVLQDEGPFSSTQILARGKNQDLDSHCLQGLCKPMSIDFDP